MGKNFKSPRDPRKPHFSRRLRTLAESSRTLADVAVGTIYGLLDGAIAGLLLGWLYNIFAPHMRAKAD